MNKHLDKAIFGIGKVDALMHSIEQLYLDFEVMPEEQERLNRGTYAFYVLWDEIREVADELDLLSGDCRGRRCHLCCQRYEEAVWHLENRRVRLPGPGGSPAHFFCLE